MPPKLSSPLQFQSTLLPLLFAILSLFLPTSPSWQDKVEPSLLTQSPGQPIEFLVFLSEQADLTPAALLPSKAEKGRFVYDRLTATARRTQGPILSLLQEYNVEYRSYWVANLVWVKADPDLLQKLASRRDVAHIYANPWVQLELPEQPLTSVESAQSANGVEPNISQVRAPDVWALGYTGQGVVVGGQDTGYNWTHAALKNQYRGWDGAIADHSYNWHDAIHSGSSSCGVNSTVPCDDYGHGTHTMGTMVGDDGGANQIGMAPGARWIGCRNMRSGYGTPATYSECYEWFIAPTDLNGQNPRPDLAPDVINNSWSCTVSEGCTQPEILKQVVQNVRAAGILTVHSAGNSGSSCSSVNEPATIYAESFSVGAVNSIDSIASFSSRGPVSVDGSSRLKPQVVAPGISIRSATQGGESYGTMSGTSMAAPHVAGLAALLISAQPSLRGDVAALESLIQSSAVPLQTSETCGGTDGQIPNNVYGWGRIDALEAVRQAPHDLLVSKSTDAQFVVPGGQFSYTLKVDHRHPVYAATTLLLTDTLPADTVLIDATAPFTLQGNTIQWQLDQLDAHASWSVQFTVQVASQAGSWIENFAYGVQSAQVPIPIPVSPVKTLVARHNVFIPILP